MRYHICALFNLLFIAPFRSLRHNGLVKDMAFAAFFIIAGLFIVCFLPFGVAIFGLGCYLAVKLGYDTERGEIDLFLDDTKWFFVAIVPEYVVTYLCLFDSVYKAQKSWASAFILCNMLTFLSSIVITAMVFIIPEMARGIKLSYKKEYDNCKDKR